MSEPTPPPVEPPKDGERAGLGGETQPSSEDLGTRPQVGVPADAHRGERGRRRAEGAPPPGPDLAPQAWGDRSRESQAATQEPAAEGGPVQDSPSGEPDFSTVRLIDYYRLRDVTAPRLLSAMDARLQGALSEDERLEALNAIGERDPELAKTRGLYLEALDNHGGRSATAIAHFVSDVMAQRVRLPGLWPPYRVEPLVALEQIAISLAADLRDRQKARRAHGELTLALLWLAHLRNLPFEGTVELLAARLGPAPERERDVQNVRQERLRQLARPVVGLNALRRWLDVMEPWRRRAAEGEATAQSAQRSLDAARRELAETRDQLDDVRMLLSAREREAQDERERARRLEERVQGAAIVSDHERTDLKAALERFLIDRLAPVLQTTADALEVGRPHIARDKVEIAQDAIREQVKWLQHSD